MHAVERNRQKQHAGDANTMYFHIIGFGMRSSDSPTGQLNRENPQI